MAPDQAFQDVLSYVEKSRLNFSIYRTPFSAQLSLKKSFVKHFQVDKVQTVVKQELNTFEIQSKEMNARLKKSEAEIDEYLEVIKEKDEHIKLLETKYDNLEKTLKNEQKKMKKERQKIAKKMAKNELNIKQENSDDEQQDEVDLDIPTSNKFKALAQDSDLVEEMKYGSEHPCDLCDQRLLSRNRLKAFTYAGEEVLPVSKASMGVQTVEIVPPELPVNLFPYSCFYCGLAITAESEIGQHRQKCHTGQGMKKFQSTYKCDQCDKSFVHLSQLEYHMEKDHGHQEPENMKEPTMNEALEAYLLHRQEVEARKYQCDICYNNFDSWSLLGMHRVFTHPKSLNLDGSKKNE